MSIFDIFKKKDSQVKKEESYSAQNDNTEIKKEVLQLMKNGIVMKVDNNIKSISYDSSKIGGNPFLPIGFEWPTFTSKEDGQSRLLSFFCQLNLSELTSFDKEKMLPDKGILSFFYECDSFCCGFDPDDKGAARVFYFEDMTDFIPFSIPKDLSEEYIIPEIGIRFETVQSYPLNEEFEVLTGMECDWDEYENILGEIGVNMEDNIDRHKILGYADNLQDEMLTECERTKRGLYCGDHESYENTPDDVAADIKKKAKDWILLLQLSTIEKKDFEWMFGDCGLLYYYIRKQDLAEKNFENMWFSVQCG